MIEALANDLPLVPIVEALASKRRRAVERECVPLKRSSVRRRTRPFVPERFGPAVWRHEESDGASAD
jgi:hypothetical protein